jgi:hypothetical protein
MRKVRHFLTTRTELWGFIKSSAQNKVVHMELSLRLSFQLRRSLKGYTVGTTTGVSVFCTGKISDGEDRLFQF